MALPLDFLRRGAQLSRKCGIRANEFFSSGIYGGGLLGFLVACDHSAADMAAGGCSRAATECVIPLHPRATVLTDLRDHAVRLMKRRGRHCLGGGCDG